MRDYLRWLAQHRRDVAVPAGLVLLALVPLWPAFATPRLIVVALLGTLLGALVASLGAWRGWSVLGVLGATLVAAVLGTGAAAPRLALLGFLPTPAAIAATARGTVSSWQQVVTIAPPLGETEPLLTAPYLVALLASLLATTLSLRARRAGWALLPPAVALVLAILLGTVTELAAVPLGLLAALGGLVWTSRRAGRLQLGRPVALLVMLGLAAAAGTGAGMLGPGEHRLVLREVLEPPLDPHAYPSPLAGFRSYLKDHRDDTLLSVANLPPGTALRLATMDTYDGTTWMVGSGRDDGGAFQRVGQRVEVEQPAEAVAVEVTVEDYTGVWLPDLDRTYDVEFTGPRAAEQDRTFYFNRTSQTGILTSGLRRGDRYTLRAVPGEPTAEGALRGAPVADVHQSELTGVPDTVAVAGSELIADASSATARSQALVGGLVEGYFSHGLEGDAPSLPGHGAARLAEMVDGEILLGDEEQYAAIMGLMARAVGLPSRVVMGFAPQEPAGDGPVEITGDDVTAWVEIAFADHGWVPFYPAPDEDRAPQVEEPEPKDRPQPQVLQPPPPAPEPPDPPPVDRDDVEAEDDDAEDEEAGSRVLLLVVLGAGIPLLLIIVPPLIIVLVKVWRRRGRRRRGPPAQRVAGGWQEVHDHARDLGVAPPGGATRTEAAEHVLTTLAVPPSTGRRDPGGIDVSGIDVTGLAAGTDAAVFGPAPPDDEGARRHWQQVSTTTATLRAAVGRGRWLRSRVSTRSLRKGR